MADLVGHLVDAPLANVLILAGIAFLAVGVIGKISGKIEPGNTGRVLSGLVGIALLVYGIYAHGQSDAAQAQPKSQATSPTPANNSTSTPTSGGESSRPKGEATQQSQQGAPDECVQGFVWREAFPTDHVCVTPVVRENVMQQNQLALKRRSPNGGAFGPDTCLEGFVWRETRPNDHVCVPPRARDEAAADNAAASSRRVSH
jgi:hypothetical protein